MVKKFMNVRKYIKIEIKEFLFYEIFLTHHHVKYISKSKVYFRFPYFKEPFQNFLKICIRIENFP